MVNDRGSIKWSSMMLPEHAKLLRKLWEEDNKTNKPILDAQQIEILNRELQIAYEKNIPVELKLYTLEGMKRVVAEIIKLDSLSKEVHVIMENGEIEHLPFHQIIDLTLKN